MYPRAFDSGFQVAGSKEAPHCPSSSVRRVRAHKTDRWTVGIDAQSDLGMGGGEVNSLGQSAVDRARGRARCQNELEGVFEGEWKLLLISETV